MTYKYTLISLFMLAIVGATSWTAYLSFKPTAVSTSITKKMPDAYMENVVAIIMDKQGKPSMKIVTPKMLHYNSNDTTSLLSPELTLYRKSPKPWYITADHAIAIDGIENVNFWDNVNLHHPADENNPATVIKTTSLTVQPNKKIAKTNDLITLIQPNLVVKATGMYADINTGDIKLLSQARGEYVPNP